MNFRLAVAAVFLALPLSAAPLPDPVADFRGQPIPKNALGSDLEELNSLSPQDPTGLRAALRKAVEKYCGKMLLDELLASPAEEPPRVTAARYIEKQSLGEKVRAELEKQLDDPEFQRKARIHYILCRRFGDNALVVTEEEIETYYRCNPEKFRLPENLLLGVISLPDEEIAKTVHGKLMQGENFERLAMEFDPADKRATPSAEEALALREIAQKMQINDISGIIPYNGRFHIIKLQSREASRLRPLAEIHDVLKTELLGAKEAAALEKFLSEEIDRGDLVLRDLPQN